ncbi:MAG TPA: BTAD domain-containing putative transcriptional regulator [Mycobacteriales bacterium]|nr:BTAD domain-containing putative transcriptional regulator [Mycobacteriales bacterium]
MTARLVDEALSPGVFLRAQVTAPRPRGLVRPRLLGRLDGIWSRQLGAVIAPAGSGKTTLLAQYAAERRMPAAWFRADGADGDADRLVRHLQETLATALGLRLDRTGALDDLLASLDRWPGDRALVILDDLHHLNGTPAAGIVDRLATLAPPKIRVLAASRTPPPLDLSRLRLADDLCEITADDLRFRSWEVERLFREVYEEPLPARAVDELTTRTGGWVAGLQLVHLSAPHGMVARQRAAFTGQSRLVGTYLARNVLADLPDRLREFVRRTCPLGLLTAPLCDRLLASTGSAALLDELEQRQICRPAGGGGPWDDPGAGGPGAGPGRAYRCLPLLRGHLERELHERLGPAAAAAAHQAAGALLEQAGAYADAVHAYARGEDWGAVRRLLHRHGERIVAGPPGRWEDVLPPHLLDDDPWLLLAAARRRSAAGQLDLAVDLYERAERGFGADAAGQRCRHERAVVAVWDPSAPRTGSAWYDRLRAATRNRPRAQAELALAGLPANGPAGGAGEAAGPLLAAGLAGLLAGHLSVAGRRLHAAIAAGDRADPTGVLAARLGLALLRLCTPAETDGDPGIDALALDADLAGRPWLARITRCLVALTPRPGALAEAAAVRGECERDGDWWGALVAALLDGLGRLARRQPAGLPLETAATLARRLDAGVLEAWARSLLAVGLAQAGDPDAEVGARAAEACARAAEAPAPHALALLALAEAAGPDGERGNELVTLAGALLVDCGLSPTRLAAWLHLTAPPAAPPTAPPTAPPAGPGPARVPPAPIAARPAGPAPPAAAPAGTGPAVDAAVTVELRVLGGFELWLAGRELDWSRLRPRARTTLRLLALHAGRPVHRETLVEALWPDLPPAAGMHSLQVAVSSLRRFLDPGAARGSGLLARAGDTYKLMLPPGSRSDLAEFEACLRMFRELRTAGTDQAAAGTVVVALRRALTAYRGDLLPEDGPAEWVVAERDRLRQDAAEAAAALGAVEMSRGNPVGAAEVLERGLRLDPFRDPAWRLLIAAHQAVGDLAAAARARRDYARVLADLGVDLTTPAATL